MPKTIIKPSENLNTKNEEEMLTLITSSDTRLSEDIVTEFIASYTDLKTEYNKLKICLNKYNKLKQINN
jgi:hypothetical protein